MKDQASGGGAIMGRRPTIREVAERAGVSIATASNAVNGRAGVKAGTRERVATAVRELGYTPDRAARSLIARRRDRAEDRSAAHAGLPRLTAVGYVSADYTARVDVLPHRDDRVTARAIQKTLGGPAANVAVAAAGLGPPFDLRAELLTVLGDDADSAWAREMLAGRGVEALGASTATNQRLSRCVVVVERNGSRTIINEPFAVAAAELARFVEGCEPPTAVTAAHVLHLDGYQVAPLARAVPLARARGLVTSVHATGLHPDWRTPDGLARLRALFHLVFLNREVARDLTGFRGAVPELVRRSEVLVRAAAPAEAGGSVLLTLGEDGAVLFEPDRTVPIAAPPVDPVDTTGAGDCFAGVFLAAWLHAATPEQAARLAAAAASRSVQVEGAQEQAVDAATLTALVDGTAPSRAVA